jgi:PAS domain S-box-containing protein
MSRQVRMTKAELLERLKKSEQHALVTPSALERERLLHELQVHQTEVETQNRELREAQQTIELARDRYADLYDFAPVGYATLDIKGVIRELNLTAAGMLGGQRTRLIGLPFSVHVAPGDAAAFRGHLRSLASADDRSSVELRLVSRQGPPLAVVLQSILAADPEQNGFVVRTAITDISARKRMEELLREERDFSAAVLETAGALVLVLDNTGRIVRFNHACELTTGYLSEAVEGKDFWDVLLPQDQLGPVQSVFAELRAGQFPSKHENDILTVRGKRRLVAWSNTVLKGADGAVKFIIATGLDITDARRAEERRGLQYEVARLLALAATLTEAVPELLQSVARALHWEVGEFWSLDTATLQLRAFNVWHMPSEALSDFADHGRALRYSLFDGLPGRVVQTRKPEWVADVRLSPHFARKAAAAKAGLKSAIAVPILFRERLLGVMAFLGRNPGEPDEDLLQVLASLGNQIGLFMERLTAKENLRRSEANLAQAQTIAKLGSYEIDLVGKKHVFSAEALRMISLRPTDRLPTPLKGLLQRVHPDDRARIKKAFTEAIAIGTPVELACRITDAAGESRFVQIVGKPLTTPQGKVIRIVGTTHDITERRALEEQVLAAAENEQRRIGHDLHDGLGQQLTGMELFCHSLTADLEKKAPDLIGPVSKIGEQLRETIRQTRALSRGLSPVTADADGLANALHELAANTRTLARIDCRFTNRKPALLRDPGTAIHLYRIAQELVNNALKHGRAKRIRISLVSRGSRVELKVVDDGKGFGEPAGKVEGMGLRVMRYRAHLIGGTLEFESGPGQGCAVTCSLRQRS